MKQISTSARKRLIILAQLLKQLDNKNNGSSKEKITSPEIAGLTGWTEATIRRDISLLELHSGVSNGYSIKKLGESINQVLNLSSEIRNVCIVGLGTLGAGLLETSLFDNSSFKLTAAFDTNQNRLDMMKTEIPLFPTLDLETKIRQLKIEYAILAVADEKSQFMADRLVKYGIRGILNYTNTILTLPPQVKLLNCGPGFMLTNLL